MSITGKVSNPLTIIAIFSALAEGFATVALIQTPPEIQAVFVYFVMFFPSLIVVLFFGVLIFNNKALYAPSDFENQDHHLELNQFRESVKEELEKNIRGSVDKSISFTEAQIELINRSVNSSIERSDPLTRSMQIEGMLRAGPSTAT